MSLLSRGNYLAAVAACMLFSGGIHTAALSGAVTFGPTYPNVLRVDPGGADRTVTLDTVTATVPNPSQTVNKVDGLIRLVENTADANERLTFVQSDGTTYVAHADKGDIVALYVEGSTWRAQVIRKAVWALLTQPTVTNSVSTEQAFTGASYSIPANTLEVGSRIRFRAQALVSAAAGADTLILRIKLGSQIIAASLELNSTTNDVAAIVGELHVRTIGASGTFVANSRVSNGAPGTATVTDNILGSTALDTTAALALSAAAIWSATTATCTVRLDDFSVEVLPA